MLTLQRLTITTILAASLSGPAAAVAQTQDLRSPDRRAPVVQSQGQDLRSPDRRDPGPAQSPQDLRNADRRGPVTVEPVAVEAPAVTAIEVPGDGFDWGDAGIGAAGATAVLAMLAALLSAGSHARRSPRLTA